MSDAEDKQPAVDESESNAVKELAGLDGDNHFISSGTHPADHDGDDDELHDSDDDKSSALPGQKLQAKWDQMFQRLVDFKKRHGHCLVPNRYSDDAQLGSWVSTQRRHYKILTSGSQESTPMTPARAQKLVSLGFKWSTKDPRHVPWEHRYEELCAFREKYGHAQVPIGWEENVQLSNWVSTQRQEYKLIQRGRQSRLTDDRISLLNKVDFVWEAQRGGPRRRKKATVAVPPKANPVDANKLRSKSSSRGGKVPNAVASSSAAAQAPAAGVVQADPNTLQQLAALGALQGASVIPATSLAVPAQQWQLLASGAFQKATPQFIAIAPGTSIFPIATQVPLATAGFQFGANPFLAAQTAQLAALQQQQVPVILNAGALQQAVQVQPAQLQVQPQQQPQQQQQQQQPPEEPAAKKAKTSHDDDKDGEEDANAEPVVEELAPAPASDGSTGTNEEKGAEIFYDAT